MNKFKMNMPNVIAEPLKLTREIKGMLEVGKASIGESKPFINEVSAQSYVAEQGIPMFRSKYKLTVQNGIPHSKINNRFFFITSELKTWYESQLASAFSYQDNIVIDNIVKSAKRQKRHIIIG